MRYFTLVDFQYWILALFLGVTAVVLVCMAWGGYPRGGRGPGVPLEKMADLDMESADAGEKNPVVPFLIVLYVVAALWAVAYMIYRGILGTSI